MAQMPMAPQGAEQEEMNEEGAAPKAGGPSELIMSVNDGLSKLVAMLGKAQGADPAAVKSISDALASFQGGVQTLLGKGGSGAPMPEQGIAPVEAGSSKTVVPAM